MGYLPGFLPGDSMAQLAQELDMIRPIFIALAFHQAMPTNCWAGTRPLVGSRSTGNQGSKPQTPESEGAGPGTMRRVPAVGLKRWGMQ